MNYIAAVLIDVLDSEADAFMIFIHLILHKDMKALFLPGVPELHLKNFQMA